MAAEGLAGRVPSWVERMLIPTLEARVRAIVKEELSHFEKTTDARFVAVDAKLSALDSKFDAKFQSLEARFDSLEKRVPIIQDVAELKARLSAVERRIPG